MLFLEKKAPDKAHFSVFIVILLVLLILPGINDSLFIKPTITSKTIFFLNALLLIGILFLLSLVLSKSMIMNIKISKIDVFLSLVVLYIIVNRYYIQDIHGFSIRYVELIGLSVFYVVLRSVRVGHYVWIGLSILVSGIVQGIYGILQLLDFFPSMNAKFNITGSFFNPGPYAGFLSSVWILALGMYLYREKIILNVLLSWKGKTHGKGKVVKTLLEYVPLVAMVVTVIVLPSTQSRAAWLSFIFGSLLLVFFNYEIPNRIKAIRKSKKQFLLTLIGFCFLILFLVMYRYKKNSADGRLLIWKVSVEVLKEQPIFGTGFDRLRAYYMKAQAKYLNNNGTRTESLLADNNTYAFNALLQYTVENGLVGLVILFVLTTYSVKLRTVKENYYLKMLCLSVLFGVFVFGLFSYPSQILPIKVVCITLLAFLAVLDSKKWKYKNNGTTHKIRPVFSIILFVVSGIFLWKIALYVHGMRQNFKGWKTAMNQYDYMKYDDSVRMFENVTFGLRNEGEFLWNYGKALTLNQQWPKAIDVLNQARNHLDNSLLEITLGDAYLAIKNYDDAEESYQRAADMVPNRFYPHYQLAKLYEKSNNRSKARKKAKEILRKEVKIPSKAIKQMKEEMRKIVEKSPG